MATGAEPVRLTIPGNDLPHVCYLRTLSDSRHIIEKAKNAKRAVVIGASFIGLEVAASLRERKVEVAVVGKHSQPLEKILGHELSNLIRETHEAHSVKFCLGRTPTIIHDRHVQLDDGTTLDGDLVVVGIGVRPNTALAEKAGVATDDGVLVNEYLETSVPGVFAAGDVRHASVKRVASAVGEGSIAVQIIHNLLADEPLQSGQPGRDRAPAFCRHFSGVIISIYTSVMSATAATTNAPTFQGI